MCPVYRNRVQIWINKIVEKISHNRGPHKRQIFFKETHKIPTVKKRNYIENDTWVRGNTRFISSNRVYFGFQETNLFRYHLTILSPTGVTTGEVLAWPAPRFVVLTNHNAALFRPGTLSGRAINYRTQCPCGKRFFTTKITPLLEFPWWISSLYWRVRTCWY
jgi:hypothetical protein